VLSSHRISHHFFICCLYYTLPFMPSLPRAAGRRQKEGAPGRDSPSIPPPPPPPPRPPIANSGYAVPPAYLPVACVSNRSLATGESVVSCCLDSSMLIVAVLSVCSLSLLVAVFFSVAVSLLHGLFHWVDLPWKKRNLSNIKSDLWYSSIYVVDVY